MGLGISSPGEERVQPRGFERSKIIEGGTEREGKNRSGDSHEQTLQNGELEREREREGGERESIVEMGKRSGENVNQRQQNIARKKLSFVDDF